MNSTNNPLFVETEESIKHRESGNYRLEPMGDEVKPKQVILEDHFDLDQLSLIGRLAMQTFSENPGTGCNLPYLSDVFDELRAKNKEWLLELFWCHGKMDKKNWYSLFEKFGRDADKYDYAIRILKN